MSRDLVPAFSGVLSEYRRAEQEAAESDDPWVRSDAAAARWLRSPRFTDGTRDQYGRIWQSWRTWCEAIDIPPLEAERSDLELYTTALERVGNPAAKKPRPLSRRSIARHMAAISSYYKRAISDKKTTVNPVPPEDRPKVNRKSRQPHLDPDEIRALIAAADADGPRSSALVALLVLGCLRVSEALSTSIEGMTYEKRVHFVYVIRKGDSGEKVPIPPAAYERVQAAIGSRKEGPILVTTGGKPLDRKAAWETVRRLGRRAGLAVEIGPHTLRHAYLTRGHELNLPVARLQDAAGHSNVDTTRGYDRSGFNPEEHPSFIIERDLLPSSTRGVDATTDDAAAGPE